MALRGFEAQYLVDARVFEPIIDMCITDGRLIANACIKLAGIEQQRVVSLPGGVRLPTDIVEPRETGELLRLTYIGRLQHSDKRVLDLITLTDKLAILGVPFSLDIVGAGPEEAHLRKELSKRISDEKLRFHGWVSRNYLYSNILPNVDCLLNFSPTEGVTISPREGMVNGVVPVISEFPGLALEGQFLHEVNALTFPVENIERAAHCVCRLWSEPGLLSKLSRAALTSQVGKYTQGGSMLEWANAFNISMTMPLKISKTEIPSQQHSGRLENLGVPPVIADTCRFFTGRQPVPDDPGSEWPHGRIRVTANDLHLLKNFSDNIDSR
ncbi:MAG: glycosyltransferase [Gammaproteobacteria bacterium]|nr:glycosyltransferase [Gammaproteobacteria bacterium]